MMIPSKTVITHLLSLCEEFDFASLEDKGGDWIIVTLQWEDGVCRVTKAEHSDFSQLAFHVVLSDYERALFKDIRLPVWQYLVEMGVTRQNNSEVHMHSNGDFTLVDYVYDDAFSSNILLKRAKAMIRDHQRFQGDLKAVIDTERLRVMRQEVETDLEDLMKRRGPRPDPPDGMFI